MDSWLPDLQNPRRIITIGACTRHHALKAPARKLHTPPRAAVPTGLKTHSSKHRIEKWTPLSGSCSPNLASHGGITSIGGPTCRQAPKLRWSLPRATRPTRQHAQCQRMPSTHQRAPGTRLAHVRHATS
jgi:hypothetical protein